MFLLQIIAGGACGKKIRFSRGKNIDIHKILDIFILVTL